MPKKGQRGRTPWAKIRADYVFSLTATFQQLGEKYDLHWKTIGVRAAKERWTEERRRNQGKIVTDALQNAFEDKAAAIQGLLHLEYSESLSHAQQMQRNRKTNGEGWSPQDHRAHADAFHRVMNRVRLALGMPTEINSIGGSEQVVRVDIGYAPPHLVEELEGEGK